MSETTLVAIVVAVCTALPPTIVALAGLRQARKNSDRAIEAVHTAQQAVTAAEASAKTAVGAAEHLVQKTDEIHTLTNGNLTKMGTELEVALKEIEGLKALVKARPRNASR